MCHCRSCICDKIHTFFKISSWRRTNVDNTWSSTNPVPVCAAAPWNTRTCRDLAVTVWGCGCFWPVLAPSQAEMKPTLWACFLSYQQWLLQPLPGPLHPPGRRVCRVQEIWMSCRNTGHRPTTVISNCGPNKYVLNLGLQRRIFYKGRKQRLARLSMIWQGACPSRMATQLPAPWSGPGLRLPSPCNLHRYCFVWLLSYESMGDAKGNNAGKLMLAM